MSTSNYLSGAHDFHVERITINNYSNPLSDLERSFQLLYENTAIGAAHNSDERHDAPACHEDTRKAVQEEIHSWITDGDEDAKPKKILSLMGPAGADKTAIAGSIADTCDDTGILAGSFFFASFSASEARRSKRLLVPTLVYHLISSLGNEHPLSRAVLLAIKRDPSVFRRRLRDQFKILLIKPLSDTRCEFDASTLPKVFILDGLDEVEACNSRQPNKDEFEARLENDADQEEILAALLYAVNNDSFPFRIIVASRPERAITAFLSDSANEVTRRVFLDEKYDPASDISLYLRAKLAKVRRRYRLPSSWPSDEAIHELVDAASGQFIYAATVIRFLQSGRNPNPQELLVSLRWRRGALAPLDALYARILRSSPDVARALCWVREICWSMDSGVELPAVFFNQFLQEYAGEADYLLENLTSLLWIPPPEDRSSPYRFHHKTFADFFHDARRLGERWHKSLHAVDSHHRRFSRALHVYKNKCPIVSLPESQLSGFIDSFTRRQCHMFDPLVTMDPSTQDALMRCDVGWWVFRILARSPKEIMPFRIALVSTWFRTVHIYCLGGICLPVCNHWRSNILRTCKVLGFGVPNSIALFREAMGLRTGSSHNAPTLSIQWWSAHAYVAMEHGALDETHLASVCPPTSLTRYTVDDEYQTTLQTVAAMRACLPADWESQFELECRRDRFAMHRGFTGVIEKIKLELGVEEPDILTYDSPPSPPLDRLWTPVPPAL